MLDEIKDIVLIGVPVGVYAYFYAQQKFKLNGHLKKIEKIPWVYIIGKPGIWKNEFIIYVQDGRLFYEFVSNGLTAARKLGKGTWYVWRDFKLLGEPDDYDPPIKSVQEFNDYVKNKKEGAWQSLGNIS